MGSHEVFVSVPKGYFIVYMGENKNKQFVIPISYSGHHLFRNLLSQAKEEFGEEAFIDLICGLSSSWDRLLNSLTPLT
ncbi:hypothetical protein NMG60_11019488 [Bertholletia excelsa]